MATPKLPKGNSPEAKTARRNYRKKKAERKRLASPYDPFGTFPTVRDYEHEVNLRAQGQYEPLLEGVTRERNLATGAHTRRASEIRGSAQFMATQLKQAQDDANAALRDMMSAAGTSNERSQAALQGAIGQSNDKASALAGTIGGTLPNSQVDENILANAQNSGAAGLGSLANTGASVGTAFARDEELAAIGARQFLAGEQGRFGAIEDDLTGRERDIRSRIPEFRSQARQAIDAEQLARNSQGFQQGLARKQFQFQKKESNRNYREAKASRRFQQWLAHAQFDLDAQKAADESRQNWANIAINQQQVDLQRQANQAAIDQASNDADKADAEAASKRWEAGLSYFTNIYKPGVKKGKGGRESQDPNWRPPNPADVYVALTGRYNLTRREALRMMATSRHKPTKKWAQIRLAHGNAPGHVDTSRNPGERPT
jgi:hypothetical protein